MISGHGNNIYSLGGQSVEVDFSSNVAFNNHSHRLLEYLKDKMDSLCNYPDPMATKLTTMVAQYHGVSSDEVLVTNGSAEAFYLLAHMMGEGSHTAIATPSFAEYEDSCRLYNHDISFVDFDEVVDLPIEEFDSLWLASPNNPDGRRISMADIEALASRSRGCRIVVDRVYNELSSDVETICEIPDNVILVESFTKLYGIPGLRLGYLVASAEVVARLCVMRPPWSVNALSQVAGEYIMRHREQLSPDREELIGESLYLQEQIAKIEGFKVTPSNCNFFLVEILIERSAQELYAYLLREHGLLIRDASNFRGLTDRHFRIAAHERRNNDKLIEALRQWR